MSRTLLTVLLLSGEILSAPIPKVKKEPVRGELHGEYTMTWGGAKYEVRMHRDGYYEWKNGEIYARNNLMIAGRYELKGDNLTLIDLIPRTWDNGEEVYFEMIYKATFLPNKLYGYTDGSVGSPFPTLRLTKKESQR